MKGRIRRSNLSNSRVSSPSRVSRISHSSIRQGKQGSSSGRGKLFRPLRTDLHLPLPKTFFHFSEIHFSPFFLWCPQNLLHLRRNARSCSQSAAQTCNSLGRIECAWWDYLENNLRPDEHSSSKISPLQCSRSQSSDQLGKSVSHRGSVRFLGMKLDPLGLFGSDGESNSKMRNENEWDSRDFTDPERSGEKDAQREMTASRNPAKGVVDNL